MTSIGILDIIKFISLFIIIMFTILFTIILYRKEFWYTDIYDIISFFFILFNYHINKF
jgi:hypothetical protein